MKKIILTVFLVFIIIMNIYSIKKIDGINTTLIIIEEQENGEVIVDEGFLADAVFNELWEMEDYIFFDMKINKPIPIVLDQLDVKPYINLASESGADSILLIKVIYTTIENEDKIQIIFDKFFYNLYSIKQLASLKNGNKKIDIKRKIKKDYKNVIMKKLGNDILTCIYN